MKNDGNIEDRIVTDIGVALLELLEPDAEISEADLFREFTQRGIPATQARFEAALQTLDGDWSSRHDLQTDMTYYRLDVASAELAE